MSNVDEDVDHTVSGYVVDYLTCALLFLTGCALRSRHGGVAAPYAFVQFAMANAYLMGALGHHLFANRAQTDGCANVWYYVCWAISYPSMSASNLLWLRLSRSRRHGALTVATNAVAAVAAAHALAIACIVFGGATCFFTVPHYPGVVDDCPPAAGTSPPCDAAVWWGEAIYFGAWFAASVLSSQEARQACASEAERRVNAAQTLLLIFGPLQILLVYDVLPFVLPSGGATLSAKLGTAVTYKTAVCANQLVLAWLSHVRLLRSHDKVG